MHGVVEEWGGERIETLEDLLRQVLALCASGEDEVEMVLVDGKIDVNDREQTRERRLVAVPAGDELLSFGSA